MTNGVYTAPIAGTYLIHVTVAMNMAAPLIPGFFDVGILVNAAGTAYSRLFIPGAAAIYSNSITEVASLRAADQISIEVYQSTGNVARSLWSDGGPWNVVSIARIGD